MWLIKLIYWLHLFIVPVLILGLAGLLSDNEMAFIILTSAGVVSGIVLAEYIRRKTGLIHFFGGLHRFEKKEEDSLPDQK